MHVRKISKSAVYSPTVLKIGTAVSLTAFLCEYLPHTIFIDKYKAVLHYYKYGRPITLNKEIETLAKIVLKDLKVPEVEHSLYNFFPITGFQTYNAGITSNFCHAIIGIPEFYTYKDIGQVNVNKIRIGYDRNSIDIYHPAADKLLNSLTLSEKAKKFGIAREILMNQKSLPIYRSIDNFAIVTLTAVLLDYGNRKLQLFNKPLPIKLLFYTPICLSTFALWFQVRDKIQTFFEKNVDQSLAQLGSEYWEGGKEFYQKELQRNLALRSLLGEHGSRVYNRDGNQLFFFRQKTTPITHRKKFFDEFKYQNNENVITKNVM